MLLTLLIAATLISCDTKRPATDESNATTQPTSVDSGSRSVETGTGQPECYALLTARDTVRLSLTRLGTDVSGTLQYRLAEKDQNTGTLRGTMRGDTLIADYTFQSEGQESVREVAFLAKDGGFVEGYGDVEEQAGKMIFTPNRPLTFDADEALRRVPCPRQ